MTSRRRGLLMGMGALLGLCAAGCESGRLLTTTQPMREMIARSKASPAAEILPPRVTTESTTPVESRPAGEPVLVRTAGSSPLPGAVQGPVVASSWRALPKRAESDVPVSIDIVPEPKRELPLPMEQLMLPKRGSGAVASETIVGVPVEGGRVVMDGPVRRHVGSMVHQGHHGAAVMAPADVPRERNKSVLPTYVVEPPDLLIIQFLRDPKFVPQPIDGQFLVRPDGTITLGVYGTVKVAGLTIDQVRAEVIATLNRYGVDPIPEIDTTTNQPKQQKDAKGEVVKDKDGRPKLVYLDMNKELVVDVLEFASKFCYVIADGAGHGASIVRIPITGGDTVLDVFGKVGGLPSQSWKKKMWVARPATGQQLPIDWCGVAMRGEPATNYQVFPGDRIFVQSDPRLRANTQVGKTLDPLDRVLGTGLLGSSLYNSITGRNRGNNTNN